MGVCVREKERVGGGCMGDQAAGAGAEAGEGCSGAGTQLLSWPTHIAQNPLAPLSLWQGSYEGLRAWGIGQLVRLGAAGPGKGGKAKDGDKAGKAKEGDKVASITLRRFYRPEDISKEQAYKAASYHEVRWGGSAGGLGAAVA